MPSGRKPNTLLATGQHTPSGKKREGRFIVEVAKPSRERLAAHPDVVGAKEPKKLNSKESEEGEETKKTHPIRYCVKTGPTGKKSRRCTSTCFCFLLCFVSLFVFCLLLIVYLCFPGVLGGGVRMYVLFCFHLCSTPPLAERASLHSTKNCAFSCCCVFPFLISCFLLLLFLA